MLENKYKQITISEHIKLYDMIIPQDHFLRKLKENVDFSFVNKLVENEYSKTFGRPANEPELMFKLLFLQKKDDLSDREVIARAKTDMSYKFFLDLNPEDDVVCPSMLSIFRTTKIKDEAILEDMLNETIRQAIEKGLIKSNSIIVDATHSQSKAVKRTPTQILREMTKSLRKEIYRNNPEIKEKFPNKPSDEETLDKEIEYTKELIDIIKKELKEKNRSPKIDSKINGIEEILKSDKIKEIQSACDQDAKQGYKSETNDFFGYKNHLAITEERFITGIEVTTGEAPDGKYLENLVEKSEKSGIEVKEVIGDKAYSGRENLNYGKKRKIKIISAMNAVISKSRKLKEGFEYIKDADTLRCPAGHLAIDKTYRNECQKKDGLRNATIEYKFDEENCKECPYGNICKLKNQKHKTYMISLMSDIHKEQQEFEETEYFKHKLRYERYKIEAKNNELKATYGLCKAKSMGLSMMRVQTYLTCITANIKRIMKLMEQQMA